MGMYDTIEIPKKYLTKDLWYEEFQTKSFDCYLHVYEVLDNNTLIKMDENSDSAILLNKLNQDINFYCLTDKKEWFEFYASFENGVMVSLKQVKPIEKEIKII